MWACLGCCPLAGCRALLEWMLGLCLWPRQVHSSTSRPVKAAQPMQKQRHNSYFAAATQSRSGATLGSWQLNHCTSSQQFLFSSPSSLDVHRAVLFPCDIPCGQLQRSPRPPSPPAPLWHPPLSARLQGRSRSGSCWGGGEGATAALWTESLPRVAAAVVARDCWRTAQHDERCMTTALAPGCELISSCSQTCEFACDLD